jgi:nucleotide-binding universal stress UspA family protein
MAERLVTATGVPVLALPPGAARDLGRVVLVAWKGSPEAARAVHDALPFLRTAERVVLCAVGERSAAGLDAAAAMLGRHQVRVQPERAGGTDAGAGEVLLAQAAAHGADLLVMGAYGHARVRELVFGGATRRVLCDATLPVLFSG